MKIVFAIFLISIPTYSAAIDSLKTIPAYFQGNWTYRPDECGFHPLTNDVYPSLITINKHGIMYYESSGNAAAIVRRSQNEVAMILEFSGDGTSWLAYKHFILSEGKKTISDVSNPRSNKTIYRCPSRDNDS